MANLNAHVGPAVVRTVRVCVRCACVRRACLQCACLQSACVRTVRVRTVRVRTVRVRTAAELVSSGRTLARAGSIRFVSRFRRRGGLKK